MYVGEGGRREQGGGKQECRRHTLPFKLKELDESVQNPLSEFRLGYREI